MAKGSFRLALLLAALRLLLPATAAMAAPPLGDRFEIALTPEEIAKAKKIADQYLKKKPAGDSDVSTGTGDGGGDEDGGSGDGDGGGDGDGDSSGGDSSSTGSGDSGGPAPAGVPKTPTSGESSPSLPGDSIDSQPAGDSQPAKKKIDPADLMFAQAHMKLAKRAFANKNMDKAKDELKQIFDRVSDLAEARFMRAVIAAKEKDFLEAWRHIDIAQKSAPDNAKVKEFVDRLQKASPKPDVIPDAAPAARPAPTFAAQVAANGLELLFAEKVAAGKVTAAAVTGFAGQDGKVKARLLLEGSAALDAAEVKKSLESLLGGPAGEPKAASEGKTLEFEVEIAGQPLQNPKVTAVSGLGDFLKGVSEETDVAIQDSSETDPDADKHQTGTYTVAAKDIKTLNDFLQKIAPHCVGFEITRFYATTFASKAIWKGELKVVFLVP